jgi:hypothetical protein
MDKVDVPDAYKTQVIEIEFFMDLENPASGSNYSQNFAIFKGWYQKDWIKCLSVDFFVGFRSCWQGNNAYVFFEGPIHILLWALSEKEAGGGKRLRAPW